MKCENSARQDQESGCGPSHFGLLSALASVLWTGFIPLAPATFTSLAALPLIWLLPKSLSIYSAITLLVILLGAAIATRLEHCWGRDSRRITIDELAGMLVTFLLVPFSLASALAGFVLFRLFDIIKLPFVRACERLPRGWGVVADDLAAGVCANVVLQLLFRIVWQTRARSWTW